MTKIIPKKKKSKKTIVIWGGLTNSWEKKRSESKGEAERYTQLKAEFQRIARRDKKAFLSEEIEEIEENSRMGKTRDLFKKIRDSKGTFYAKMGTVKDRDSMDLTEAEDIKKRWQETQKNSAKKAQTVTAGMKLKVACSLEEKLWQT